MGYAAARQRTAASSRRLGQPERLAVLPLDVDAGNADILEHVVAQLQQMAALARAITPDRQQSKQRNGRTKEWKARRRRRRPVDCRKDRPHRASPFAFVDGAGRYGTQRPRRYPLLVSESCASARQLERGVE